MATLIRHHPRQKNTSSLKRAFKHHPGRNETRLPFPSGARSRYPCAHLCPSEVEPRHPTEHRRRSTHVGETIARRLRLRRGTTCSALQRASWFVDAHPHRPATTCRSLRSGSWKVVVEPTHRFTSSRRTQTRRSPATRHGSKGCVTRRGSSGGPWHATIGCSIALSRRRHEPVAQRGAALSQRVSGGPSPSMLQRCRVIGCNRPAYVLRVSAMNRRSGTPSGTPCCCTMLHAALRRCGPLQALHTPETLHTAPGALHPSGSPCPYRRSALS